MIASNGIRSWHGINRSKENVEVEELEELEAVAAVPLAVAVPLVVEVPLAVEVPQAAVVPLVAVVVMMMTTPTTVILGVDVGRRDADQVLTTRHRPPVDRSYFPATSLFQTEPTSR